MSDSRARTGSDRGVIALVLGAALLLLATLWAIFVYAPVEAQMGLAQKIFYFHVPSAYSMYVGFVVCAVASGIYLFTRREAADAWAVAGAEVAILFCAAVLVSGPLWARKAWGVWWLWDPRLTTTLLAGLILASYLALRAFGGGSAVEKRFAAGLAIVGLLDVPIIHYSVRAWSGQHPQVITGQGGGLHPDMKPALWLSFLAFTLLVTLLIWLRARVERSRQRLEAAQTEGLATGALEER